MDSERGRVCGKLPVEIIERVLSFLPVPALCKMRSVCKSWRELMSRPGFHDLCDLNGPRNEYMLMWRGNARDLRRGAIDPGFTGMLCFLDVDSRRWYSIQASELPRVCACGNEMETRLIAVHDGLVCELTAYPGTDGDNLALVLSDPVAKTRRMLPSPPLPHGALSPLPKIVTIADDATGSYKVFLLNSLRDPKPLLRVYEHKSSTAEWLERRNLPTRIEGLWAISAVTLQQTVFVSNRTEHAHGFDEIKLLSYNVQEDTWTEVWNGLRVYRSIRDETLVVSHSRLFSIMWTNDHRSGSECPWFPSICDCSALANWESFHHDSPDRTLFEVYEVLIAEKSRKLVVQLTNVQLQQIFGSNDPDFDVACGFPCYDSNGRCSSIVLVSKETGQIRRFHLATGSVDVLPAHPLLPTEEPAPVASYACDSYWYDATTTKLNLRNLLAKPRTTGTSTAWRLLQ